MHISFTWIRIVHYFNIICARKHYLFKYYIKYKSKRRFYCIRCNRGKEEIRWFWNFIPIGHFGRFRYLARRVCCVYQNSPFCITTERQRERERTCLCNRYMKHRCSLENPRYVFSVSGCTVEPLIPSRAQASVCIRYLSSAIVYHLILLFHSSKFKHFTPAVSRFVFPVTTRRPASVIQLGWEKLYTDRWSIFEVSLVKIVTVNLTKSMEITVEKF